MGSPTKGKGQGQGRGGRRGAGIAADLETGGMPGAACGTPVAAGRAKVASEIAARVTSLVGRLARPAALA
ncbi:hypothetical protein LNKW23_44280 [Paralimibaculum aggregatum]|uniref:Uncharacterized protein n=1 Tax=Paralimibaculum aggregatum TaxID=3036245 RepID=A0ABQ6LT20_9RHOB|nr:hypothetical protein LNKW23_44280 [Limibaculum sp. NKW23]